MPFDDRNTGEYTMAYVWEPWLKRYQRRHFLRGQVPKRLHGKPTRMFPETIGFHVVFNAVDLGNIYNIVTWKINGEEVI